MAMRTFCFADGWAETSGIRPFLVTKGSAAQIPQAIHFVVWLYDMRGISRAHRSAYKTLNRLSANGAFKGQGNVDGIHQPSGGAIPDALRNLIQFVEADPQRFDDPYGLVRLTLTITDEKTGPEKKITQRQFDAAFNRTGATGLSPFRPDP